MRSISAATHGLLAWHWQPEPGYMAFTVPYDQCQEFNANNCGTSLGWHFEASGFVGAMQSAFALLWQAQHDGDPQGAAVAKRLLQRWCEQGLAPNGLMRRSWHPGRARGRNGSYANPAGLGSQNGDASGDSAFFGSCWPGNQSHLHARTAADAVLYLARCWRLVDPDSDLSHTMHRVLRQACRTALALQRDDGHFGFIYDLDKNAVIDWRGEAGLWWLPALGEAHDCFSDEPAFQCDLLVAMRRAGHCYAAVHEQRCSAGAPEDTVLAATSESPQAGVMGYRHLHRLDPDGNWIEAWRDSADWLLTFQKVFNQRFAPNSLLTAFGLRTFGTQYASTQNNQPHCYGLQCIGDLIRLAEASVDPYYEQRAREHAAYSWQMLSLDAGHWGGQRGMCTEQFNICDWSIFDGWDPGPHHQQKGTLMGSSHSWCITFMLLGLEQLESVVEAVAEGPAQLTSMA
jgi:hypothetical protein